MSGSSFEQSVCQKRATFKIEPEKAEAAEDRAVRQRGGQSDGQGAAEWQTDCQSLKKHEFRLD